ncbi:hypothetical protein [Actinomadura vinacea]|uniref:hypothetical protein n=1 Tax=Actinomadura vinacea TaxID=115336 RepID=UPI0031D6CCC8
MRVPMIRQASAAAMNIKLAIIEMNSRVLMIQELSTVCRLREVHRFSGRKSRFSLYSAQPLFLTSYSSQSPPAEPPSGGGGAASTRPPAPVAAGEPVTAEPGAVVPAAVVSDPDRENCPESTATPQKAVSASAHTSS